VASHLARVTLCATLALASVPAARVARAHGGGAPLVARVERVVPAVEGIDAEGVLAVAPMIRVGNRTSETLTILGERGEPLARIGAGGAEINAGSPTARHAFAPLGRRPNGGGGEAHWVPAASEARLEWFDPRLSARATTWIIPALLGTRPIRIEGHSARLHAHGRFVSSLEGVRPATDALEVRVLDGPIPAIFVRNRTGLLLEVPGGRGEPYLRIGPQGVEANRRSPTYWLAEDRGQSAAPADADSKAPPEWIPLSPHPTHAWLEHRARLASRQPAAALGDRRRVVLRWTTPMSLGGAPLEIDGRVEWIPAAPIARIVDNPAPSQ
jgi:hypothetical protein